MNLAGTQLKIVTSPQELEKLVPLWQASPSQPLADYECFNLIVRSRHNVISPCVLVLLRADQPVAVLAGRIETTKMVFRIGYATFAKIPVRQVVFVGGGFMGERTPENWTCLLKGLNDLIVQQRLDAALLEQIKVDSDEHKAIQQFLGRSRSCPMHDPSEHWLLRLPPKWDDFLKTRSKKHRYWLKRIVSVLDREFPNNWTIKRYRTITEVKEFADAAEKVAQKTYHRKMGVGFSNSEEYSRRMWLEASRCQLQGYVLFIGGEPKTFWYCLTYQDTLHLAATGYDPEFRSYEIGTVLLLRIFQDHCGTGVGLVDFGLGDAGYKKRFGSESFMEMPVYIFPKTFRGAKLLALQRLTLVGVRAGKSVLNRLGAIQRFKTYWRRKFERKTNKSDTEEASPSEMAPRTKVQLNEPKETARVPNDLRDKTKPKLPSMIKGGADT